MYVFGVGEVLLLQKKTRLLDTESVLAEFRVFWQLGHARGGIEERNRFKIISFRADKVEEHFLGGIHARHLLKYGGDFFVAFCNMPLKLCTTILLAFEII
jgi:hypothetical protein